MKPVKTTARQRLLLTLGLFGGVITWAFMPTVHSISYVRYVSPPLADGTRYTFLRPDYLDEIDFNDGHISRLDWAGTVLQGFQADRGISVLERAVPSQLTFLFHSKDERIVVLVHKSQLASPSLAQQRTSKTIKYQDEIGTRKVQHAITISDLRSQRRFDLMHSADNGLASFRRDDETIANSFRVLPPGTAVPSP